MKILYFASFRERLKLDAETLDSAPPITGKQLLDILHSRGEHWQTVLDPDKLLFAVNQEICALDTPLDDSDEVAFFPPVTGG